MLERLLETAVSRQPVAVTEDEPRQPALQVEQDTSFRLTHLVAAAIGKRVKHRAVNGSPAPPESRRDVAWAREVLATVESDVLDRRTLEPLAAAVRIEIAIAAAESESDDGTLATADPLFRLRLRRWAMKDSDLPELVPVPNPELRLLEFDYDVSEFRTARTVADFPQAMTSRSSYIVAFRCSPKGQRGPLQIDSHTARVLELSDGTRSVAEIDRLLEQENHRPEAGDVAKWIKSLFVRGLLGLQEAVGSTGSLGGPEFKREVQ